VHQRHQPKPSFARPWRKSDQDIAAGRTVPLADVLRELDDLVDHAQARLRKRQT
jgi:hypothetical protein